VRHKRQSGGQPNNQNARKHGTVGTAYAANLTKEELSEYWSLVKLHGMDPQMAILRAKLGRAIALAPGNHRIIMEGSNQVAKLGRANMGIDKEDAVQLKKISRGIFEAAATGDLEFTKRVASKFLEAVENSQIE
jgi:hypothetical protein